MLYICDAGVKVGDAEAAKLRKSRNENDIGRRKAGLPEFFVLQHTKNIPNDHQLLAKWP
jgi:hypothetical protein